MLALLGVPALAPGRGYCWLAQPSAVSGVPQRQRLVARLMALRHRHRTGKTQTRHRTRHQRTWAEPLATNGADLMSAHEHETGRPRAVSRGRRQQSLGLSVTRVDWGMRRVVWLGAHCDTRAGVPSFVIGARQVQCDPVGGCSIAVTGVVGRRCGGHLGPIRESAPVNG